MSIFSAPRYTLFRFSFRQLLKGGVILGFFVGAMIMLQGVAYQKAYGTHAKQVALAASLQSAPAIGFIYGNPKDLYDGTQGYLVYRLLGFTGVVSAVWALMATTKLLRGAEEDGRYEVIRTGAVGPRQTVTQLATGFAGVWWVALLTSCLITFVTVKAGGITTTVDTMFMFNLGIFLPSLLFGGIGILTSQLGLTRSRAILYGVVPIAVFWLARGMAIVSSSLHWLIYWTPFGWAELIDPLHGPDRIWIYVLAVSAITCTALGIQLARRDYGSSIFRQATTVRSHFILLTSPWKLALRQNFWVIFTWAFGALCLVGLIAGLTNTAIRSIKSSYGISKAVNRLGGSNNFKVAFMGAGIVFIVMILLAMSVTILGGIRKDEAKQYLDNILIAPQRRTTWLAQRLLLGLGVTLVISLLSGLVLQTVAASQHITLDFGKVMATNVCVVGSIGFLLGFGGMLYGLAPRLAVIAMYVVIGWSFLITLLASAVKLNTILWHSSLFEYTNFDLSKWPDWATFGWLIALGVVMAAVGIWAFARRDIIVE